MNSTNTPEPKKRYRATGLSIIQKLSNEIQRVEKEAEKIYARLQKLKTVKAQIEIDADFHDVLKSL